MMWEFILLQLFFIHLISASWSEKGGSSATSVSLEGNGSDSISAEDVHVNRGNQSSTSRYPEIITPIEDFLVESQKSDSCTHQKMVKNESKKPCPLDCDLKTRPPFAYQEEINGLSCSQFDMLVSKYSSENEFSTDLSQSPLIRGLFNPEPRRPFEESVLTDDQGGSLSRDKKSKSSGSNSIVDIGSQRNHQVIRHYCDVKVVPEVKGPRWDRHHVFRISIPTVDDLAPKVIYRRFNDFVAIHEVLIRLYPFRAIPDLPARNRIIGGFIWVPLRFQSIIVEADPLK